MTNSCTHIAYCGISIVYLAFFFQAVVVAVDDNFYKIMSEALFVLTLVVVTIRPLGEAGRGRRKRDVNDVLSITFS